MQPAPGLAQLPALIDRAERAGLPATLTVTGDERPLPAAVDLAAYRIIQESLTNTFRHAGPATAAVSLTYADGGLRIEVTDDGRGGTAGGHGDAAVPPGHGLVGMRERAGLVGGSVEAGPAPAGGYRVAGYLPTGKSPVTTVAAGAEGVAGTADEIAKTDEVAGTDDEATGAAAHMTDGSEAPAAGEGARR